MLSNSCVAILMCFIAYASSQTYTKLNYTDCGSRNVQISRLSVLPMPILQPGAGKVSFAISTNENIKGVVKANLTIVRIVGGISLPVRCYIVENEQVGSCSYSDLCELMKRLIKYEPGKCPQKLIDIGLDCNCPVNINKRDVDIDLDVDIPVAPEYASWLSVGDFNVKLIASVGNIYGCYDIKFAVKPNK